MMIEENINIKGVIVSYKKVSQKEHNKFIVSGDIEFESLNNFLQIKVLENGDRFDNIKNELYDMLLSFIYCFPNMILCT